MHLWNLIMDHVCLFLKHTWLFLHPEASFFPSGDQAMLNTQCVCPKMNNGVLKQSVTWSSLIIRSCCLVDVILYPWMCGGASQLSSPRSAPWCHLNHWPDIWNKNRQMDQCLNLIRGVMSQHNSIFIYCYTTPTQKIQEIMTNWQRKADICSLCVKGTHLPVGLKATEMTASVCPCSVLVQRVTARTLNRAWGWYTTGRTCSVSTPRALTHVPRLDTTSISPCTKNASGTGSS